MVLLGVFLEYNEFNNLLRKNRVIYIKWNVSCLSEDLILSGTWEGWNLEISYVGTPATEYSCIWIAIISITIKY